MLLAVFFFSLMNVCAKWLPRIPVMEIVFFRCLLSVTLGFWWMRQIAVPWKGSHCRQLLGRGLAGTISLYFFFVTVQNIPLAKADTIHYLSPFFAALLAMIFLSEKVKPVQWLFFAISFLGVVMLKGFDERVSWGYLALGLLAAMLSGVAFTFVRSLKGKEHPLVVVFYFQLTGFVVSGIFLPLGFVMPDFREWTLLVAVGLFAHFGQVNLTKAIQGEKVGVISSLNFLGAILGSLFGWLLFDEHVTWENVFAMLLVIAGVLLNLQAEKRLNG